MGSSDWKRSGERGFSDPIIAISSPPGRSPRGLVRVSGEGLGPAVEAVLGEVPPPRRLKACRLRLDPAEFPAAGERAPAGGSPGSPGSSRRPRGGRELPCLALYHPGPGSFTGEDVLEIQAPGHPALLERVVRVLLAACRVRLGAGRLAEAGAFTRRAYTAGRIDLTRAEGVAATIGAVSDAQLEAARQLRSGRLGAWASGLVERFAQLLALVEAGIDFVDQDDVVPITPGALDDGLAGVRAELAGMLDRSRSWSALEALPRVVLAGAPNAGKSTLFNALLGRERTVTSGVAGTTRDVIREPLRIRIDGGRAAEVMLADAAGVEDAGGAVGGAGARSPGARDSEPPEPPAPPWDGPAGVIHASMRDAARRAVEGADLVVLLDEGKGNAPAIASKAPVIRVRSKADRGAAAGGAGAGGGYDLSVSAVSGAGLDALRSRIAAALRDRAVSLAGQMLALRPRHHEELRAALAAVERARELLADQREAAALADMELIAGHMREALDRLGALGGRMTPDDVIGRVFATFCVGK